MTPAPDPRDSRLHAGLLGIALILGALALLVDSPEHSEEDLENRISAIDLASYEVIATVSTGSLPNYAVFGPDSARVYISNAGDNAISEVDTGQWVVRRNFATGNSPEHMTPSPDGQRLAVFTLSDA